ncbi:3'(2'),5'-bisphosphate nucleotidase CysQ [Novosphingopyxis sp. YJ-S2-01]|uniref:3'(2'),5'-bisphosphate nucleotidase CysQ n=1 Tax=Novosphingopyxis sp. YJ-S2-01 TaxID=2794021 RepID=UPI002FC2AC83
MSVFDPSDIVAAAREAGDYALARWRRGEKPDAKTWEKSPGHPVCDIDIAVDELLKERLGAILPEAGWLSEETEDDSDRTRRDWTWLVDPVDGTRDYIRGRAGWAISIALMKGGRPVFSVIHAPVGDRCFTARRGEGALLNGEPIEASERQDLPGARVPSDGLARVDRDLTMVAKPNSIALRICMVASGEADMVATLRWGNEWDVAAANLIAAEAGATVSDALGDPIRYNKASPRDFGLIVSAPGIHAAVVERLADRAAEILGGA